MNALLRALELNPNDTLAHLEVGRLLRNQGQLKASNREYEIAYSLDPLNQLLDSYRAQVLQQQGENAAMMKLLRSQLAADPDSSFVYGNLQIFTLLIGAAEESLQFATEVEAAGAASAWNYAFKAIAASRLGLTDAAWQAIALGEDAELRNHFVRVSKMMQFAAGNDVGGLGEYAASITAGHGGRRVWQKWAGLAALMQGENLAAVESLEAAFSDPDWYSGNFPAEETVHMLNLVTAYRGLGERAKADAWLKRCAGRIEKLRDQEVSPPRSAGAHR